MTTEQVVGAELARSPGEDHRRPVPVGVDPSVPSAARMYDYCLRGKTSYAADREAVGRVLSVVPLGRYLARANRSFVRHAVREMARQGITQFIDLGAGMPASPAVHEIARIPFPAARVLYVDNDLVVTAHNRALLATGDGVSAIYGDICHPGTILGSPELAELIDFAQPTGVLFAAVLHFIADTGQPHDIVRAFTGRMAPGSCLAVSHITSDGSDPAAMAAIGEAYARASAPAVFRPEADIRAFFTGLELLDPGLIEVEWWSPDVALFCVRPSTVRFLAGIGRKTRPGQSADLAGAR